ncbi:MAG: SRPBCC family protein [Nocardioides sp.]
MAATRLSESRAYPLTPADGFARLLPMPLPDLFSRRYLAIPPVRETREQPPTWEAVGQTRRIVLADGGTMLETLTHVEPPLRFGYTLSELTGPLSPLATTIDGEWTVEPAGTGCRISWTWDVHPRGRLGSIAMPIFARLWHGYARQALGELERLLVA